MLSFNSSNFTERLTPLEREACHARQEVSYGGRGDCQEGDGEISEGDSYGEAGRFAEKKNTGGLFDSILARLFGKGSKEEDSDAGDENGDGAEAMPKHPPLLFKRGDIALHAPAGKEQEGKQPVKEEVVNKAPPPPPKPAVEQGPPTKSQQDALDGNSTDLPTPDEKAPPGMTVDKINQLNGGLLGKLGNNQDVKKDGNSVGHLRDVLAKDPNVHGDIDHDPDAAWRAYRVLTAVKNEKNPDGSAKPDDFRHNGSIGGFTAASFGDAAGGSEAGTLQDYLVKGRVPSQREDQKDPHCGANGGGTTGLQTFGNMVKFGFEKFGDMIKDGFIKVGNAFVKLGEDIKNGFIHFGQMVVHGFKGIGDAIRGDTDAKEKEWAEAREDGHKLGDDIVDGFKQLGTIAEELGPMLLDAIPGVGVELSVAVMAAKFGAEMALKAGLKEGTKEFTEMALKEGGKELAKATAKAGAKEGAKEGGKDAGSEVYQDTTGETPQQTKDRLAAEAKAQVKRAA